MTTPLATCFMLTFVAYLLAKYTHRYITTVPVVIYAIVYVILFLAVFKLPYQIYYQPLEKLFSHFLGYITVALAVPLANLKSPKNERKSIVLLLFIGSVLGAIVPMCLALILGLNHHYVLAFATRAVTTPFAINIAQIIHSPIVLASLIVVFSGIIGAMLAKLLIKHPKNDKAYGLALGLSAHAIGTIEAWQHSATAGRYAALGMVCNAIFTSFWLPIFILFVGKYFQ